MTVDAMTARVARHVESWRRNISSRLFPSKHRANRSRQILLTDSPDRFSWRLSRSEHSVRVGTRNVRPDQRCGVFRVADDLQGVPMFDGLAVGVHPVDVDA